MDDHGPLCLRGFMPSAFGQHLRALREQRGDTQAKLAAALQLKHQSHIAHLEAPRGDADWPTLQLLTKIAGYFEVSVDALLFASPESVPPLSTVRVPWPAEGTPFRLLGPKLRLLRTHHGWTLEEWSRHLQDSLSGTRYSRSYLSNVEASRKLITVPTLIRLVTLYSISSDYFLRDDVPMEPPIPLSL